MIPRTSNGRLAAVFLLFATMCAVTPAMGIRAVEGAIEVAELYVVPGPPARVRAVGCPSCPRTFRLADDYDFAVNGEPLPRDRWLEQQGKVGTLIYNLETEQATHLRW